MPANLHPCDDGYCRLVGHFCDLDVFFSFASRVVLVMCDATLNQLYNAVLSRVGGVHGGYQRVVAEVKL
jgi:hypothetical protein